MRVSLVFMVALALAMPSLANACRETTPEHQFQVSDTVLVGRISSATIRELDSITEGTTESDAWNQVMVGHRIFRIVVTEMRKWPPISVLNVEVDRCSGAYSNLGERVIAYHDSRGWRIKRLASPGPERGR